MVSLLFSDQNQRALQDLISNHRYELTRVNDVDELKDAYLKNELPILILLSQPPQAMMEVLASMEWVVILCFVGVRFENKKGCLLFFFENELDFDDRFKECSRLQKIEVQKRYIDQLGDLSEDDRAYLCELSGMTLNQVAHLKTKKNTHFFNMRPKVSGHGIVLVLGNPEVACKLAQLYSKHSKEGVLIIDGNLLKPTLESYFNITKTTTRIKSHLTGIDNSGINIALDSLSKGFDLEESMNLITHHGGKNLRVMLGNYNLYNYEHYDIKQIKILLLKLQKIFGTIILSVGENPYDSVTMLGLHMSKVNLITCKRNHPELRFKFNLLKVLRTKQGISARKNLIVTTPSSCSMRETPKSVGRMLFKECYAYDLKRGRPFNRSILDKIGERINEWD